MFWPVTVRPYDCAVSASRAVLRTLPSPMSASNVQARRRLWTLAAIAGLNRTGRQLDDAAHAVARVDEQQLIQQGSFSDPLEQRPMLLSGLAERSEVVRDFELLQAQAADRLVI